MAKRVKQSKKIEHDWLTLVTQHGLFISEPVLQTRFPQGVEPVLFEKYRMFKKEWDLVSMSEKGERAKKMTRWLNFIFEELLEFGTGSWAKKGNIPEETKHYLLEYDQWLAPDRVLLSRDGKPLMLVMTISPGKKLEKPDSERRKWKVSPYFKLSTLCLETKVPLGVLTNGDEFRVFHVKPTTGTSYFEWKAQDWYDEKPLLDSFYTLLRKDRFFGANERLLSGLIEESQKRQLDVTDQLGEQMQKALSSFIRDIGDLNKENLTGIFKDASGERLYEMSLTVMMRLVFILYSEENGLLPHGLFVYENNYGLSHLIYQLQTRATDEDFMRRKDAWPRILALFRLIYRGCEHPDVLTIAYGGELFDPEKYPELEDPKLKINNRTIWNMLHNLGYAKTKIGKLWVTQKVSYRTIDVEQIGSVYESLIGYSVESAKETMVVFSGKEGAIRPLSEFKALPRDELEEYLKSVTGKTPKSIQKILDGYDEQQQAIEIDDGGKCLQYNHRKRFEKFLDGDGWIEHGQLYMTRAGSIRKGSGTYYTPKEITRFLVREALEPLVYEDTEERKRIKSPREILDLKVCDPAMGSGAFLVQAIRYLGERLVESWAKIASQNPDIVLTMPYGRVFLNPDRDEPIPEDEEEALQKARLYVAQHCIYGVDLNPMAVELAKVSIWLTTMSKNHPLTFLDHRLKCGNSLIGADFKHIEKIPNEPLWKEQRKDNKAAMMGEVMLSGVEFSKYVTGIMDARKCMQGREISAQDVIRKEIRFKAEHTEDKPIMRLKRVFDLWCSVWFWPYSEEEANTPVKIKKEKYKATSIFEYGTSVPYTTTESAIVSAEIDDSPKKEWHESKTIVPHPPHTGEFREIALHILGENPNYDGPRLLKKYLEANEICAGEQKFFHWELEFPEIFLKDDGTIMKNPGFNAVVGNPPWDKPLPLTQDFFNQFDPNFRTYDTNSAKEAIDKFCENSVINDNWKKYQSQFYNVENFLSNSTIFQHQTIVLDGKTIGGHQDMYKYFIEKSYSIISNDSTSSLVVSDGFYLHEGSTGIRHLLIEKCELSFLLSFVNKEKIFPIHLSKKFCLIKFKKGMVSKNIKVNFRLVDPANVIEKYNEAIEMDIDTIRKMSPIHLNIIEISDLYTYQIAEKIVEQSKLLSENDNLSSSIQLLSVEYNQTHQSKIINRKGIGYPIYQGKNIEQYTSFFAPISLWSEKNKAEKFLNNQEQKRIYKYLSQYLCEVNYHLKSNQSIKKNVNGWLEASNIQFNYEEIVSLFRWYRVVVRNIAASTNVRSLISTIIPKDSICADTLAIFIPRKFEFNPSHSHDKFPNDLYHYAICLRTALQIVSILNSYVINFYARMKMSEHFNIFTIYQLPVHLLNSENYYFKQLIPRVARLICTSNEYSDLWNETYDEYWNGLSLMDKGTSMLSDWEDITPEWTKDCGINNTNNVSECEQILSEIEALIAHLYNINEEEFSFIIDTFPSLKRREISMYGEFRTKRMCLEEFKRLAPIIEEEKQRNPEAFEIPSYNKVDGDELEEVE